MMINKWMTRLLGSSGRKVDQVQILYLSIAYLQLFVLAKVIAPQKKWKLFTSRKLCQSGHSPHFSSSVASSCEEFSGFVGGKKTPSSMKEVLWVMSFAPSLEHSGPMAWKRFGGSSCRNSGVHHMFKVCWGALLYFKQRVLTTSKYDDHYMCHGQKSSCMGFSWVVVIYPMGILTMGIHPHEWIDHPPIWPRLNMSQQSTGIQND